jgi:uncharacterized protein (TIGR02145 family)
VNIFKTLFVVVFGVSACIAQGKINNITVIDADSNEYHTIKIGTQVWTLENLRTTKYNDGSKIPFVADDETWATLTSPAYCWYNNDIINKERYGALYNWYAIKSGKLAIKGWHIPKIEEVKILEDYLIANGYNWDGTKISNKIAKSIAAKTNWEISTKPGAVGNNLTKNNASGFTALPGGIRGNNGKCFGIGIKADWWSATETNELNAHSWDLHYEVEGINEGTLINKYCGQSVRLIKD